MRNAYDAMPVSVLLPQKLKPKTIRLRRYLSRAYPLKKGRSREKYFMGCTQRHNRMPIGKKITFKKFDVTT